MEIDWIFWKNTVKEALPFGLTGTLITFYYWIDSVMLSLMQGNDVVGYYNAAYRVALVLLAIPMAVNGAIVPILSQFYITSRSSLKFAFEKHFKYMIILALPIGVGITLLADKIILLIFGVEYEPSIIALQILVWGIVLIFARTAFERLFESINQQIIVTKVFGGCVILNVILNLILIPKYSYIGASIATVMTDLTVFILVYIWSSRLNYYTSHKKFLSVIFKVAIASVIMGIFLEYFKNLSSLILVLLAVGIYVAAIFLLKAVSKEDINLLRKSTGINWKIKK